MVGKDFVKMIEVVAGDGGARENCCLKLVRLEGMDKKVDRADVLDDEDARRYVQKWQWQWILPKVLPRRRRPKVEADPHGG